MSEMAPDWVVIRMGDWEGARVVVGSSALADSIFGAGVVAGRSVMETGKWPVWNVLLCRRRWPERDLGSVVWDN